MLSNLKLRILYFGLIFLTIALGLLSRSDVFTVPTFVVLYVGDVLWALMVFWIFRFLFPKQALVHSALLALLFSFVIEFSQLYQAAWIDSLRHTRLGGLVLGFGFRLSDLLCYSVGVVVGFLINFYCLPSHDSKRV